jgi:ABC-type uncharacterized transport system substrate-binding protein
VLRRDVTTREEIEQILRETPAGVADAIYHVPSSLVGAHIELLIQKAKQEKLPLIVHEDSMVNKGALVSYGADFRLQGMQAARLVAKILKGKDPADMPIQTPDKLIPTATLAEHAPLSRGCTGLSTIPILRRRRPESRNATRANVVSTLK